MRITWAAWALRIVGLEVVEESGWATRGDEFARRPLGILLHHDVSPAGSIPRRPSSIIDGRGPPDPLAGPLAQWYLNRRGVWHVVASGKANHAGRGSYNGLQSGPNGVLLGIEAANTGTGEPWPERQMFSYIRGVGIILHMLRAPSLMAIGHKEWAPTRKIDPSFDMNEFRRRLVWTMCEVVPPFPGVDHRRNAACHGTVTRWIRRQLARLGYGVSVGDDFDVETERAVNAHRRRLRMPENGVVDQAFWRAIAAPWPRPRA